MLNPNGGQRFAIPIGIGLTTAAIEALLLIGNAIIVGSIAYIIAEEIAQELKRQNEYRYYKAILKKGAVYIGDGIRPELASSLVRTETETGTVMATSLSYARGITGGAYRGSELHGGGDGYWVHLHVQKFNHPGQYHKSHLWYLT